MLDGIYQSVMCFFMPYLMYRPANFETMSGLTISDRTRVGVVVAACAIMSSNFYVMLNSYNWDWLTVLINCISSLLLFFWTGVFTSGSLSYIFYGAAHEVYGTLNFWIILLLTIIMAILPRFVVKSVQKVFFPYDTDIIREQISAGKFDYLKNLEQYAPPPSGSDNDNETTTGFINSSDSSGGSTDYGKPIEPKQDGGGNEDDDRSVYVSPIANIDENGHLRHSNNPHSQDGSVTTTNYAPSLERHQSPQTTEYTLDRNRPSFERIPRSVYHVPSHAENPFRYPNERSVSPI